MAWTAEGAHRRAARKIGMPEDEYLANIKRGQRRCYRCKLWLDRGCFTQRGGHYLGGICRPCKAEYYRERAARLSAGLRCEPRQHRWRGNPTKVVSCVCGEFGYVRRGDGWVLTDRRVLPIAGEVN